MVVFSYSSVCKCIIMLRITYFSSETEFLHTKNKMFFFSEGSCSHKSYYMFYLLTRRMIGFFLHPDCLGILILGRLANLFN